MDGVKTILACIAIMAVILLGIGWKIYAYGDCKHVGHSKAYCIVHFMSN